MPKASVDSVKTPIRNIGSSYHDTPSGRRRHTVVATALCGQRVSIELLTFVGNAVGMRVGVTVGLKVGAVVGRPVGGRVGVTVGAEVGVLVGVMVGCWVGLDVTAVGLVVIARVGALVTAANAK